MYKFTDVYKCSLETSITDPTFRRFNPHHELMYGFKHNEIQECVVAYQEDETFHATFFTHNNGQYEYKFPEIDAESFIHMLCIFQIRHTVIRPEETHKLRRMFCWDSIVFDDFHNGGIYKYGKSGLDLFVPYSEISGFENYGNHLCFNLRNDSCYIIDFMNESDCEDAIEYLTMEAELFFDERHYLRHQGEIDLYYQQKMLIGDTDIFIVDYRSMCYQIIPLDHIQSVEIYGADNLKLTDYPDVGESWRVGTAKCQSYGATHYFCCATKRGLDTAYEVINRALEERKRK